MAGAGYKLFNTGDVLTAAQVNTYLQEQTVMVFANSTARTTALSGVLAEGMVSYLQDTNAVEVYNGSSWVALASGDVTEVQAGTGISVASGTGPIPVVTNTMATAIDAKGDLLVGTGADTFTRLAVGGTNGHTLQVDSSTATGLKWAAASGGGGKVLQVIHASYGTATSNSTSTFADTGLSATITPSSASSKVLVLVSQNGLQKSAGNLGSRISLRLMRGATEIASIADYIQFNGAAQETIDSSATFNYLDSPATTSATTYKTQFQNPANVASVTVQFNNVGTSHIVLMEIGA